MKRSEYQNYITIPVEFTALCPLHLWQRVIQIKQYDYRPPTDRPNDKHMILFVEWVFY